MSVLRLVDANHLFVRETLVRRGEEHQHPHHELLYVCRGPYAVAAGGPRTTLHTGQAVHLPPGLPHRAWVETGAELIVVQWCAGPASGPLRVVDDPGGRLITLCNWLVEARGARDQDTQNHLLALLVALLAEAAGGAGAGPVLDQVRRWVGYHLGEPLRLLDLQRRAGMSRAHFCRTFQAETGLPPMRWLRRQRALAARAMIVDLGLTPTEAARRSGLGCERSLQRAVRAELGVALSDLPHRQALHTVPAEDTADAGGEA